MLLFSSSLRMPPPLLFPQPPSSSRPLTFFSTNPSSQTLTKPLFFPSRRLPPNALPASDQELLDALTGADGGNEVGSHLPAVRSYENDLSRLTLIGAVGVDQALTAAAADGGDAADEHLSSGSPTMVVETVFPGSLDEHSTVSTRLFLPARKVKERAKKMRSSLTSDILSSSISRNILALTFRQVVIQHTWSFELALFFPGTERNMDDLPDTREIPTYFTVSSSDGTVLNVLAEAICSCALEGMESHYLHTAGARGPSNIFGWFQKPQKIVSSDSSVSVYKISEVEIVKNAKKQVENFNMAKKKPTVRERKLKHKWWTPPTFSVIDKVGGSGPGFSAWINEYIPAYRLQIDAHSFKDAKLQGWQRLTDNRWEALLTHFQMVELANILDMFYEDPYTVPDKQLSCRLPAGTLNCSRNKINSSWKVASTILAGGCILISIGILVRVFQPNLLKTRKSSTELPHALTSVSELDRCQLDSLDSNEFEALSISLVTKIKDALGRPGDIVVDPDIGAWIGELPSYLRKASGRDHIQEIVSCSGEVGVTCMGGDEPINASSSAGVSSSQEKNDINGQPIAAQDIASYQVSLTRDGQIVGFMPTSRLAVNHWAANPPAEVLYGGRKLSPGILEPRLSISRPDRIVLIELLMSVDSESWFVLARPVR